MSTGQSDTSGIPVHLHQKYGMARFVHEWGLHRAREYGGKRQHLHQTSQRLPQMRHNAFMQPWRKGLVSALAVDSGSPSDSRSGCACCSRDRTTENYSRREMPIRESSISRAHLWSCRSPATSLRSARQTSGLENAILFVSLTDQDNTEDRLIIQTQWP